MAISEIGSKLAQASTFEGREGNYRFICLEFRQWCLDVYDLVLYLHAEHESLKNPRTMCQAHLEVVVNLNSCEPGDHQR